MVEVILSTLVHYHQHPRGDLVSRPVLFQVAYMITIVLITLNFIATELKNNQVYKFMCFD